MRLNRALISVYRKDGIAEFARILVDCGVEILATGNTFRFLIESGIEAREVSDYTGSPEILNGRVKTLHPKIHGGILSMRDAESEVEEIPGIDLVVVDLYPFYEALRDNAAEEELIEKIDIGGVTLLRSAAKNYKFVLPVSDIRDYVEVISRLSSETLDMKFRRHMAAKAFFLTSEYDAHIASWMHDHEANVIPDLLFFAPKKVFDLRCGENPHQKAAFFSSKRGIFSGFKQLSGKELSYNNIADMESGYKIVSEFTEPAAAIIKHCNPCGAAIGTDIDNAYSRAFACDEVSSFGGCIAVNRPVNKGLAMKIVQNFFEIIIAPKFDDDAIEVLSCKKNIRLITAEDGIKEEFLVRSAFGGYLVQEHDSKWDFNGCRCVTEQLPSEEMINDLSFAWKICKHVKSNAIVIVRDGCTIGVGAGQMSRIESVEIAIRKGLDCNGAVLASDGFFPFGDSIDALAKAGVKAVIQPGGSIRDEEVVNAANANKIVMLFTGRRSFFH